jgi:subtilisin family serine protease
VFKNNFALKTLAKITLLASSVFLVACGGSDDDDGLDSDEEINFEFIETTDLTKGNTVYFLTDSSITSVSARYGDVTEDNEIESLSYTRATDASSKVWKYKVKSSLLDKRSISLDYVETLTFTNKLGEVKEYDKRMFSVDEYLPYQWHIYSDGKQRLDDYPEAPVKGIDLNVLPAWHTSLLNTNGDVVKASISGDGVKVLVFDMPIDFNLKDLKQNRYNVDKLSYSNSKEKEFLSFMKVDPAEKHLYNNLTGAHGTSVAGIISAANSNGGVTGVAPKSKLLSLDLYSVQESSYNGSLQYDDYELYYDFLDDNKALPNVINMSLGYGYGFMNLGADFYLISDLADNDIPVIKSIGNEANIPDPIHYYNSGYLSECYSSNVSCLIGNEDEYERNSTTITVGALNHFGSNTDYSTASPSMWISAFGGTHNYYNIGIISTYSSLGCSSLADLGIEYILSTLLDETDCKFTSDMNGTSAATPQISGVVALMQEANKKLSAPQIKYILAKTAKNDEDLNTLSLLPKVVSLKTDSYSTIVAENGWSKLNDSLKFSNQYGFGLVDTKAAVDLAIKCEEDADCARRTIDDENDIDNRKYYEFISDSPQYQSALNCTQTKDENRLFVVSCTIDSSWFEGDDDYVLTTESEQIESVNVNIDAIKFRTSKTNSDGSRANSYCYKKPNDINNLTIAESADMDKKYSTYQVTLTKDGITSILKPYSSVYMPFLEHDEYLKLSLDSSSYQFALTNNFYLTDLNSSSKWEFEIKSVCEVDFDKFKENFGMRLITYPKD